MVWKRIRAKKNRNVKIMKIEIPKYNYTKDQLEQLRSLLSQYEFDTPENRELVENVANNFLSEIIQQSRDEKINLIL